MNKGYLILQNGMVFPGERIGALRDAIGELVYTSGHVGYPETLTDPSNAGQIVMHTFPVIGSYGMIESDFEGKCGCFGYVVREISDEHSNFRADYTLREFLERNGIPGLAGVDTRAVAKVLREEGVMNAMIAGEVPEDLSAIRAYRVYQPAAKVTTNRVNVIPAVGETKKRVVLIDYGAKAGIPGELSKRGCEVTVVPSLMPAGRILEMKPDGVLLSNGPGDPAVNVAEIEEVRTLLGKVPLFGICLGHQLLALAVGAKTRKLASGHRGGNQPVRDKTTGRIYMTSQNHGYAVDPSTLPEGAAVDFEHADDRSCEGITYPAFKAFSVQFHPEACAGPREARFLFDRFISLMEGN